MIIDGERTMAPRQELEVKLPCKLMVEDRTIELGPPISERESPAAVSASPSTNGFESAT